MDVEVIAGLDGFCFANVDCTVDGNSQLWWLAGERKAVHLLLKSD